MVGQLVASLVSGFFGGGRRKNDAANVVVHNHFHPGNLGSIRTDLFGPHQPTATLASNGANPPRIERSPRIVIELESNATTGFGNGSGSDNNSGSRINWPQGFENNSSYA